MSDPTAHPSAGVEQITLIELLDRDAPAAARGGGADLFGRYRVLGLLGSGGMGAVYRVWDSILEDEIALKMLKRELLSEPGVVSRFRQEVKLARRVTHPNVVRTFDLGEQDGDYYLTMEYIRGRSVRRILAEEGVFSIDRGIDICRQTASGLGAAHAAGVLHCDLKPDNLLLDDGGRVAITDFGIARAMGVLEGIIAGTPAFMAPELAAHGSADARTDIYALGVVLFEVLTGMSPWVEAAHRRDPSARLLHAPPDPRALIRMPDALAEVIQAMLAPLARDRPGAVADVLRVLEDVESPTGKRLTPSPRGVMPSAATPSLAVLPLTNAGGPEDAHIADGLTEEIIDALSATRGLRVRPLSSTLGQSLTEGALAAGRALDVSAVVEGTVRRRNGDLVLAVRLIGVADGFQLWARRFHSPAGDAMVVAEAAARAIAEALTAELAESTRVESSDPVALELYLRARQLLRVGWDVGAGEAVGLLEQALARRPNDPDALASYAMALARQAFFEQRRGSELAEILERVRRTANLAAQLAPEQGDVWLALANAHLYSGHAAEAGRALREAVRRAPGSARAQQMLGSLSLEVGHTGEAIERFRAALAIDPANVQARTDMARCHALLGSWREADEVLDSVPAGQKGEEVTALTRARLSLWAPGRDFRAPEESWSGTASARMVTRVVAWYRIVHDQGVAPPELLREAESPQDQELSLLRAVRGQFLTEMLGAVGDHERAVRALRDAVNAGLTDLLWMQRCPTLAGLRELPAWKNLYDIVAGRAATIQAALDPRRAAG